MNHTLRLALLLVCSLSVLFGQADANKGQITGMVTDPNAAVIAGAKLNIKNLADKRYREGSEGYFAPARTIYLSVATKF